MGDFGGELSFMGTAPLPTPDNRDEEEDVTPSCGLRYDDFEDDSHVAFENPHQPAATWVAAASRGSHQKKGRVAGGRAAQPKKIGADYDSDDGRIISLKQQGYADEYVADRLIREGRIRYVPKTIGSRWLRLRRTLFQAEEETLDDCLSDWHEGEDEKLEASIKAVNEKLEKDIEKMRSQMWKHVSANLADRLSKRKYTAKASRERRENIENGTALLPIELDPDQEGRRVMRETRTAEAKRLRAELKAANKREEEQKKYDRDAKRREKVEQDRLKIEHKIQKNAEKEADRRIKEQAARLKTWRQNERIKKRNEWSRAADWKQKRTAAERAILDRMIGRSSTARRRAQARKKAAADVDDSDVIDDAEIEEDDYTSGDSDADCVVVAAPTSRGKRRMTNSSEVTAISAPKKTRSEAPVEVKITKETLENPLSVLSDAELVVLLFRRGLARREDDESHAHVVARIATAYRALSNAELNDILHEAFEPTTGMKADKIRRIEQYDVSMSEAGRKGIRSYHLDFIKEYEGYKGDHSSITGLGRQENGGGDDEDDFTAIGIPRGAV